ncbi:hypothetical protein SAMN05421788_102388 [Filimonas lacunae]|uniref:Uncharacterized protein n=1 Tax=Filimonas lacunae TaxID=477680 RepID=A0A173MH89_9BACT|nr:hypothetical protein [Filimonas lacunae]BAV06984.1 hypothetical protein FLA_3004 [Filimonas lacunae]SIS96875.1 hypothetical protein SAMN05421788_102388 [Filimonas lacunae]
MTSVFRSRNVLALYVLLVFTIISCKKEYAINGYVAPVSLPDSITAVYGDTLRFALPDDYARNAGITLSLQLNTPNQKVQATDSLDALIRKAIVLTSQQMTIRTGLLYPNNMYSATYGNRLPDTYDITLLVATSNGLKGVSKSFKLKVLPASLGIKEINSTDNIPYGYSLYSDAGVKYTVDFSGTDTSKATLELFQNGREDSNVWLSGNQVVINAAAGDPAKKAEWTYDLIPSLSKDGYTIARKQFRAVLLPKPKFFYGTYYADYDLSVITNRVVIGLGNAYTSPAPAFNPAKYKGSFRISSITKDGADFTDTGKLFSVNSSTGAVSVASNSTLTIGNYSLTVEAITTNDISLTATFTLVME